MITFLDTLEELKEDMSMEKVRPEWGDAIIAAACSKTPVVCAISTDCIGHRYTVTVNGVTIGGCVSLAYAKRRHRTIRTILRMLSHKAI